MKKSLFRLCSLTIFFLFMIGAGGPSSCEGPAIPVDVLIFSHSDGRIAFPNDRIRVEDEIARASGYFGGEITLRLGEVRVIQSDLYFDVDGGINFENQRELLGFAIPGRLNVYIFNSLAHSAVGQAMGVVNEFNRPLSASGIDSTIFLNGPGLQIVPRGHVLAHEIGHLMGFEHVFVNPAIDYNSGFEYFSYSSDDCTDLFEGEVPQYLAFGTRFRSYRLRTFTGGLTDEENDRLYTWEPDHNVMGANAKLIDGGTFFNNAYDKPFHRIMKCWVRRSTPNINDSEDFSQRDAYQEIFSHLKSLPMKTSLNGKTPIMCP